jgi:hypothetical protein
MDALSAKDLLDTPFFNIEGLLPIPHESGDDDDDDDDEDDDNSRRTTINISTTKREVLDNYYTCSVGFVNWVDFASENVVQDLEAQASLPEERRTWASLLVRLLKRSFGMSLEPRRSRRNRRTRSIRICIQGNCFGFTYAVVNGCDYDFEVRKQRLRLLFFPWRAKSPAICHAALRIAHNYGPNFVSLGLPLKLPAQSQSTKWNGRRSPQG